MADTFQAFFAIEAGGPLGPTSYRAGYRYGETGNVICALELPASIVETALLRNAKLAFTLAPDGHIRFSVFGFACEEMSEGLPSVTQPIDELIAQSVAVDSLRLEEITPADLNSLLQRLHRSVALVQDALKHMSDRHVQNPR